jgi:hypothetical protein
MLIILVPHLKRKDILFNAISEAIAWVQNRLATGKRSTLKTQIRAEAEAVAFGKGEAVEHNWDTYMEIAQKPAEAKTEGEAEAVVEGKAEAPTEGKRKRKTKEPVPVA